MSRIDAVRSSCRRRFRHSLPAGQGDHIEAGGSSLRHTPPCFPVHQQCRLSWGESHRQHGTIHTTPFGAFGATRPGPADHTPAVSPGHSGPVTCRDRPERSPFGRHPARGSDPQRNPKSLPRKGSGRPCQFLSIGPPTCPDTTDSPRREGADDPAGQGPGARRSSRGVRPKFAGGAPRRASEPPRRSRDVPGESSVTSRPGARPDRAQPPAVPRRRPHHRTGPTHRGPAGPGWRRPGAT